MKESKAKKIQWCPTQGGNTVGFVPEYKNSEGEWHEVDTKRCADGIPPSKYRVRLLEDLGLFTHAQAQALAWAYAAFVDADIGKEIEVRVQEYEVVYDLKARKIESE